MTNEEAIELTNQAVAIALGEIRSCTQEAEKLKVKNEVLRSILLGVCRCYAAKDTGSERLFEAHIGRIHDHISGLTENHPYLKTVADDVREFLTRNDAPLRPKFEVIEGGGHGRAAWAGAGVDGPTR
ncbi:MAG: hypothetical protein ACREC0_03110 [Methylocella sp.]